MKKSVVQTPPGTMNAGDVQGEWLSGGESRVERGCPAGRSGTRTTPATPALRRGRTESACWASYLQDGFGQGRKIVAWILLPEFRFRSSWRARGEVQEMKAALKLTARGEQGFSSTAERNWFCQQPEWVRKRLPSQNPQREHSLPAPWLWPGALNTRQAHGTPGP